MKNWNYRVAKDAREENGLVSIREVYYADHGGVEAITVNPVTPKAATAQELKQMLKKMIKACNEEVLLTHSLNDATAMRMPKK